jgi:hypothetical protein
MLETVEKFLKDTKIPLRLSGLTNSGWPFVMSLWYIYLDEKLYLATLQTAKVVKYLSKNSKCAFEIASDIPPYCGIRGQALAKIIDSKGDEILKTLLYRYLGGTDNYLAKKLMNRRVKEIAIELTPINVYKWDFSSRMRKISIDAQLKVCP